MMAASSSTLVLLLFLCSLLVAANRAQQETQFVFHGFPTTVDERNQNLTLEEAAFVDETGRLKLTNRSYNATGRAFHSKPFQMLRNTTTQQRPKAYSFSTSFIFSIVPSTSAPGGFGLAFVIAPSIQMFLQAKPGHSLGIYNGSSNDANDNHMFVVEFDTVSLIYSPKIYFLTSFGSSKV